MESNRPVVTHAKICQNTERLVQYSNWIELHIFTGRHWQSPIIASIFKNTGLVRSCALNIGFVRKHCSVWYDRDIASNRRGE